MAFDFTTPALLFPAISLMMVAYTTRFLSLASLIRQLDDEGPEPHIMEQIRNLRSRIQLIKRMQEAAIFSFLLCVVCMFTLYLGFNKASYWIFGASLITLAVSLLLSVWEIRISVQALDIQLDQLQDDATRSK